MANLNPIFRNPAVAEKVTLFTRVRNGPRVDHPAQAGALMKTQYIALRPDLAAAEAIKALHRAADQNAGKLGAKFYIYVTDEEGHLVGVFSLSELIAAHPGTLVQEFMKAPVIRVEQNLDVRTVAQTIAEFNLLEMPVVDDQNRLQGIITAEDALDTVLPPFWRKRLPRFSR